MSWYELQQRLWKEETIKNKQDANAWYNYYSATRAMRNSCYDEKDPQGSAQKREQYTQQGHQIVEDAYKAVPNSFEANHMKWWDGGNQDQYLPFLLKAYEINPNDVRTYDDLMIHYEVTRNKAEFSKFCNKEYVANDLSATMLNWAYNLLSELDENAVVFTVGDNDTYSAWIVQEAKNFRKDVKVINTFLIQKDDYRNKLLAELKLPPLAVSLDKETSPEQFQAKSKQIFDHFLKNTAGVPVYISVSGISQFEADYSENLFITGLAYKYSTAPFDNISLIRRNYEKRYLLDYLKEHFSFNPMDKHAENFDAMYLPSMLKLYKHYQESEELFKMHALEASIIAISEKSGQQGEIHEFLDENKANTSFLTALLDVKSLEENMLPVYGKIKMAKYETSNDDYRKFLNNVLRSRQLDLFKTVDYDSTQWMKKFQLAGNEQMRDNYHSHPAYGQYPVVNISYEAAVAYCEWLTQQYNLQRKRKYTKVLFRLPTEKEWRYAAGSGNETAKNSFQKEFARNAQGVYLVNINPGEGKYGEDGSFYTARVDSYYANKSGFFNMTGNVAEMISKKGVAKGGSWYQTLEESDFNKSSAFSGPDPGVGFRIVMEIIEE